MRDRPTKVVSDQGSQLISSDNSIKGYLLSWEQVQGQEARSKTTWEFVPASCQWRSGLVESRVRTLTVTLKYVLYRTLRGEEPTLSYKDLCTLLAMVANAVNQRPVALWTLADDFVSCTVNQMLIGRMPGAPVEHCDDLKKHSLAGWKNAPTPWKENVVGIQRLVLLVPTDKVELLRMYANCDFGPREHAIPGCP